MRVLFFMKHAGAIRNFESVVRSLAERGHEVELAFDTIKTPESLAAVRRLAEEQPRVGWTKAPSPSRGPRSLSARALRQGLDYLRYLEPEFRDAGSLRERARRSAPRPIRLAGALARRVGGVGALRRALARVERSLPPVPALESFLAEQRPDVVLVTPLVGIGSTQADVLRAARRRGVPTVYPVLSWDNLTNKGLVRDVPDLTLVWNEAQREEAVALHALPPERVEVTGASAYDHWFDWSPSTTPEQFAAKVGLAPGIRYVLWVCSSPFIAPDEVAFVRRWLDALRAEGSPVAELGVLVRPHPQHAGQWDDVELGPGTSIWPRGGEDPLEVDARRDYFDSIHHAAAVAGINTSAQVESAILGRPVHTVLADEFRGTQEGTLHFKHIAADDGHLIVARSLAEHVELLAESIRRPDETRGRRFLEAFLRPHGLAEPATPRVVAAIERVAGSAPLPAATPAGTLLVHAALRPVERRLRASRKRAKEDRRPDPISDARKAVSRLARTEGPVLAGPWLAEVGYELLYWIPFLRQATRAVPGLAERLVIVSRGGTRSWYEGIAADYVELYDEDDPAGLARRLADVSGENKGYRKQYVETSLDRELIAGIRKRHDLEAADHLHPATMFGAYRALAKSGADPEDSGLFAFEPFAPPEPGPAVAAALPPETFTAVRFYFGPTLPETEENRRLASEAVRLLADRGDVVVLTPPGTYDEHSDLELPTSSSVHRLDSAMAPRDNLAVQTAAIGRATGFVGTYGGLSYLPLFLGIPALALHSEPRFRERHLELARRLSARSGFGDYAVRPTEGLELESALAAVGRAASRVP